MTKEQMDGVAKAITAGVVAGLAATNRDLTKEALREIGGKVADAVRGEMGWLRANTGEGGRGPR